MPRTSDTVRSMIHSISAVRQISVFVLGFVGCWSSSSQSFATSFSFQALPTNANQRIREYHGRQTSSISSSSGHGHELQPLQSARYPHGSSDHFDLRSSSSVELERNTEIMNRDRRPGSSDTVNNNMMYTDGTNDTLMSVVSSVTHWADIMRQGFEHGTNATSLLLDSVLDDTDLDNIEQYWDLLLPTVSYLGTVACHKIYKALVVAYRAHRGQMRKSGEPFIVHPVEVSILLSGLKMDSETVMAGLLHDTVEDTELTFAQVEALFGQTVRSIVEGETKVSKLPKQLAFSEYADEQAENLRQMFVAMTDDYRIIIVKLADRLHNMRTLRHMKPHKQLKISRETLDIFAPLAHRMGIWQFKSELEDTAFMYLYPVEYKRLNRRLREHQKQFRETLDTSQRLLQQKLNADLTLRQQEATIQVFGRTKEIYSLWHKMESKDEQNLDNIMDVVALRVIISPPPSPEPENETDSGVWLCYHVLGLVQHLHGFQPVPTKVKDYISFPKPNGYQSLHTALILNGQTIEVQIRTKMMHQVAEFGMASHWAYTADKRRSDNQDAELYNTPWLSSIKEWQNDKLSSRDFVDSVRRELLGKRVFVFLRNGKILNLARGATAIDAAFQIHTEIGLTMHGVEINGKPAPFSYELMNGDVVSILTGKGKPATDWMRFAKSRSTRSKLRAYFRARQRSNYWDAGKNMIMDYLWMYGPLIEKSSFLEEDFYVPTLNVEDIQQFLPGRSQYEELDDLLVELGKKDDLDLVHKVVSQVFEVPKKILTDAENTDNLRPLAAGSPGTSDRRTKPLADFSYRKENGRDSSEKGKYRKLNSIQGPFQTTEPTFTMDKILSGFDSAVEFADPDHLCQDCLPVRGDSIVGTRPRRKDTETIIPTVHRMGCPHAQKAINRAWANQRHGSVSDFVRKTGASILNPGPKIDSVGLRQRNGSVGDMRENERQEVPVKLEWSDFDKTSDICLAEIVVVAQDRKLLLADCSEVVSETVEIVKTGSLSTQEHATLVFLIQVDGLQCIQALMDRLGKIRSVMSVERRFGSELLH